VGSLELVFLKEYTRFEPLSTEVEAVMDEEEVSEEREEVAK